MVKLSNLMNDLRNIPQSGLITFINNRDKTFYLIFSPRLATTFLTQICKLKDNIHDCKELQLAFNDGLLHSWIERGYDKDPGSIELRSQYERIVHEYITNGFSNMREGYKAIGYRLKKYVLNDFRRETCKSDPLVYVCGKSPSLGEIVLGIFDSIPEANEWCEATYGDKVSELIPIFKDNALTIEYHNKHGYKICR